MKSVKIESIRTITLISGLCILKKYLFRNQKYGTCKRYNSYEISPIKTKKLDATFSFKRLNNKNWERNNVHGIPQTSERGN
jgi:hypothetical protein